MRHRCFPMTAFPRRRPPGLELHVQEDRLWKKHHWDGREGNHHQPKGPHITEHRIGVGNEHHAHGDHRIDDAGRVCQCRHPLVQNLKNHETKEAQEESQHGHTFEEKIKEAPLVQRVDPPKQYSRSHLRHTDNDRHFHFHRIHIDELIVGAVPRWIQPRASDLHQR